ncbi:MAG: ATP-binding protein, partial [Gammaproteobacteria bacterium]|nr:ATP-binding protein [Gammaproteobacteria bacterium]
NDAYALDTRSNERLAHIQSLLDQSGGTHLREALTLLASLNLQEQARGRELLAAAGRDARYTLIGTAVALAAFVVFLVVTLVFFRLRILRPLERLQRAMMALEIGAFTRVVDGAADPGISPLLSYYNQMLGRLELLEKNRRQYLQDLQREVNNAAHTLIAQHAAMARSERLAAVGETAAALAHELRNPLAGLQVGCANLKREMTNPALAARLGLMEEELRRMSRLLDRPLRGARQSHELGQPVVMRETLEGLLKLLRYQVPDGVTLRLLPGPESICMLPLDQLRQAVLNLVLNAVQALAGQGAIEVEIHQEAEQLRLIVADDGPGFSSTLLREGIRPFASNKEQGTGLGLAMVRRFVRNLGGEIQLRNLTPHGAQVSLLLPCPNPSAEGEEAAHGG